MRIQMQDGSRDIEVTGRVAVLVRWLAANVGRVTRPDRVQVTFDCAGSTVHATVKESEPVEPAQLR